MSTVILFEGENATKLDSLDDRPANVGGSSLLWADFDQLSEEETRDVSASFGLDGESSHRLSSTATEPYFRESGSFIHVTAYTPQPDGDALMEIECVVGESWVVTVHDGPVAVLEEFAQRASGSGAVGELDGPTFLANLIEWVINEHSKAFERIEEELEQFDMRAMRGGMKPEDEIDYLVDLRARVGRLRRSLTAHRAPLLALAHPELVTLADTASAARFGHLLERLETAVQTAGDARESIVNSFDVLIARTTHRTNEIVKVLTLASVIFLPGALIAGALGMNFKVGLFQHPAYFWVAITMMAAIAIGTITAAKARHWI
jgi:magnesium transporter